MERRKFVPKAGTTYRNRGGGIFRCISSGEHEAIMQNISSLWTLTAHGCGLYKDGTMDWDYSTGGCFAEQ